MKKVLVLFLYCIVYSVVAMVPNDVYDINTVMANEHIANTSIEYSYKLSEHQKIEIHPGVGAVTLSLRQKNNIYVNGYLPAPNKNLLRVFSKV